MKKIGFAIIITGFALGANAQSNTEENPEVKTECLPGVNADSTTHKIGKKFNSKPALYMSAPPKTSQSSNDSPYQYARLDEKEDSNLKNAIGNLKTFFRRKI